MNVNVEDQPMIKDLLRLKVEDQKGKELIESVIEKQIEKRFSRKPSKAIQLVFKDGKIVHIHCKAPDCGNEWKIKDGNDLSQKFDIKENPQGTWTITCRKCERSYLSG